MFIVVESRCRETHQIEYLQRAYCSELGLLITRHSEDCMMPMKGLHPFVQSQRSDGCCCWFQPAIKNRSRDGGSHCDCPFECVEDTVGSPIYKTLSNGPITDVFPHQSCAEVGMIPVAYICAVCLPICPPFHRQRAMSSFDDVSHRVCYRRIP